ncbi:MAG: hypothetical protein IJ637_05610 [Prevotella sp.]|nr:hypothetical protein [Prevotella sp.]
MKELIDRFLNEQTTPAEEHQIAQMLRSDEDVEAWLTEDNSEQYDKMVSRRQTMRRLMRWAAIIFFAIVMPASAVVIWHRGGTSADSKQETARPAPTTIPATVYQTASSLAEEAKAVTAITDSIMPIPVPVIVPNITKPLQQTAYALDIEQRIADYCAQVPQEQIYLHTDRPYYVPGDTVWMRAHLVDAFTHKPVDRSRYVYIELHDSAADTLVQRIVVKCDSDGVFANAITLPRHLHGGSYTLAAYTQWMRNFPVERFCYQPLTVVGNTVAATSIQGRRTARPSVPKSASPQGRAANNSHLLQLGLRKGLLLVQYNEATKAPLACMLYGSGNNIVTEYTPGRVLRLDSRSLRPGNLNVAIVNRQTGDIMAENHICIKGSQPLVSISGQAQSNNDPITLNIDVADADGLPLQGNFSLSVADYDVVKPDNRQPTIADILTSQPYAHTLSDMLSGHYPDITYGFQTSQTISGQIRSTIFKKIKHPKLMLVCPNTGLHETFELGDSSRFTLTGLDFVDGTTYILEGMRQTGSTSLVQLNIDPVSYPTLHTPLYTDPSPITVPDGFAKQAREQVIYGSVYREIELPEIVKLKKRQHKPTNLSGIYPFRAFYDDDPTLNNFHSMETLLSTLGFSVYFEGSDFVIHSRNVSHTFTKSQRPTVFIDEFRSNVEELMLLDPASLESIEYFDPVGATSMTIYGWNVSLGGLLLVRQKPGHKGRYFRPLSMVCVQQQGWKPNMDFYSPQYHDKSTKTHPDHRTTLYWNPKLQTDANGHATVSFYASDISKRYLVTLEGVSDDGIIILKQAVIE